MHELGIVFHIIREVKKTAAENNCKKVSKVIMDIGEVSTVVPTTLKTVGNGRWPRMKRSCTVVPLK